MPNTRLLLGLILVASAALAACTTKTNLGKEGQDAGQDAQAATACTPVASSVYLGCNEDPNLPKMAGSCEPDGTCVCYSGFVLNPATKRCKLVTSGDAGILICTVGADQTCNDDPSLSMITGTCVGGVACACKTGFLLNPATGLCKAGPSTDAGVDSVTGGLVCTFLVDRTCNDDDTFNGTTWVCAKGGTCACNTGFVINPATGRCRAGVTPDAATTARVCTPGDDQTCIDQDYMSALSGICQSDGTCICRPGYLLNPSTGRCGDGTVTPDASVGKDTGVSKDTGQDVPDALVGKDTKDAAGVCTPGMDQTCNDSPIASYVAGTCQSNGTCICNVGYVINPSSGRCALGTIADASRDTGVDSKAVCTPGQDQTCNDDISVSSLWGTCESNGTCTCGSGFVINTSTGRCMAPAAGTCAGTYDACGCGCCGSTTPSPVCYYPSAGDSLSAIIAAEQAAKSGTNCSLVGCYLGQRYLCCMEAAAEPAGSAQYGAKYTVGGYDRIGLSKTGTDGNCVLLNLVNSSDLGSSTKPLHVSTPDNWFIDGSISASLCGSTTVSTPAIGAQGTVVFSPSGTSCAISAHITLFFAATADAPVTTMRIDADNVPISGGPTGYCP